MHWIVMHIATEAVNIIAVVDESNDRLYWSTQLQNTKYALVIQQHSQEKIFWPIENNTVKPHRSCTTQRADMF
jgi:hypothetical protein